MLKVKRIKPLFTGIVTTMNTYEEEQYIQGTNLVDTTRAKGGLKEYQEVISVGRNVMDVKVGDLVCINPKRYMVPQHNEKSLKNGIIGDEIKMKYNFNVVTIDGKDCLLIQEGDIDFVIEDYEEVPDKPVETLVVPEQKLILG